MTTRQQALAWGAIVLVFGYLVYLLSPILLPFVLGMALAYLLDPVADLLERWGLPRLWATVIILLTFVIVFVLGLVILLPMLIQQLTEFLQNLPGYLRQLETMLRTNLQGVLQRIPGLEDAVRNTEAASLLSGSGSFFSRLTQTIISSTSWFLGLMSLLVIAPVVAFYLLRDWDKMVAVIDRSLPRDHANTIRRLLGEMDEMLAGFIRGQGMVALILGSFYAVSLSLIGLNFGLLIGIVSGILTFIPYVGSFTGFFLATGMAFIQFQDDWLMIGLTAGVFVFGQIVEGNIITPKLVGDRIRLHPVWLIFALVAFGYLMGFVGALIAMPVAAIVGVMVRFGVDRYYHSRLYKGKYAPQEPQE